MPDESFHIKRDWLTLKVSISYFSSTFALPVLCISSSSLWYITRVWASPFHFLLLHISNCKKHNVKSNWFFSYTSDSSLIWSDSSFISLPSSAVQHEEYGTGAQLPVVWWDGEAAHPSAVPTQHVSAVCGWGVGTKRLSSSRSPSRAQLTSFHSQHSLPTTGTQTHTQNSWPPGTGPQNRWRKCLGF